MLPDRSVTLGKLVQAHRLVRHKGMRRSIRRLEHAEPHLALYLMEAATGIYRDLDRAYPSHRAAKAMHRRMVRLALICIDAVRSSA